MATFTYPDGSQLTAIALTEDTLQAMMQLVTCQALGIIVTPLTSQQLTTLPPPYAATYGPLLQTPFTAVAGFQAGQFVAVMHSLLNIYGGESIAASELPAGTVITGLLGDGESILMSNPANVLGRNAVAVITDPEAFSKVRIGWQQQGQPAWNVNQDVVILRAEMLDTEYGRGRDAVSVTNDTTNTTTDVNTRAWRVYWTFYGPNATDRARALRTALTDVQFVADQLAAGNLYVNPSIPHPRRLPEEFQGQWWTRVDLYAEFNEQVTETYTVGTVAQVPVQVYTDEGLLEQFSVPPTNS